MPANGTLQALRLLSRSSGGLLSGPENVTRQFLARSMATEAQASAAPTTSDKEPSLAPWDTPVTVMTYKFPSMEPRRFVSYSQRELQMPLRKDLLHRAIVYEGDMTRQGTASTKWRADVHGSHRKLIQQKGSGRARVGDRQSPIRVGGGVAHGPHPRDFSTDLPVKIYDQAWRTALSYRYQRGELIVISNKISLDDESTPHLLKTILTMNGWGSKKGRSTFITTKVSDSMADKFDALQKYAIIRNVFEVDVKNLLETQRLIIEREALDQLLKGHSHDLNNRPATAKYH